jgi:transposase-like protein
MRRHDMRVADIARHFGRAHTTVREWVLFGREPTGDRRDLEKLLVKLEKR